MGDVKRGWLYRQKGEDGKWSSWRVAELGIPSLLVKAQDRPDEYEVEEIVGVPSLPPEALAAIGAKAPEPEQSAVDKMVAAFTVENPYAKSAEAALAELGGLSPQDEARPQVVAEAQALATLALAYEQRQTRFDLFTGLENHAQQTGTV